ncbi:MAG: phytoene/squalene synthase family protein [Gammaproteobacteria bacterium]
MAVTAADLAFQGEVLQGVSRTFALTIPTLPPGLREVVGNAYLLCRIADTIEDDAELAPALQQLYSERFSRVVEGREDAQAFADALHPLLAAQTPEQERELIRASARVLRITHGFSTRQRQALARCVRIMGQGMSDFQHKESLDGLPDMPAMDRYCYYVAGVVGEMLTELFCAYSPAIDRHRDTLMRLAVSFGQGLQMTNILKDIWEDRARGACWLPRDLFLQQGLALAELRPAAPGFAAALGSLIAVARGHLANALSYTLLIPAEERGIRRFCLWALGMAVLTLRKANRHRGFAAGSEVKITRRSVRLTVAVTNRLVRSDRALRWLFSMASRGLLVKPLHEKLKPFDYGIGSR